MKTKKLVKMVQSRINVKVDAKSKHFSSEVMEMQIEALIEVIAPLIELPEKKAEKELPDILDILVLRATKGELINSIRIDMNLLQKQKRWLYVLRDSMERDTFIKEQALLDGLIELCEGIQDINEWVK